ncbi:MAG: hypothetical protein AB1726_17820 [Planctomycetota bacterium]
MIRIARDLPGGLLALLLAFGPAFAAPGEDPPVSADAARLLAGREREVLHEAKPIALAGLDPGDGGFRARTPILLHASRAAARVDGAENRRRRLALYEARATFDRPLPREELAVPPAARGEAGERAAAEGRSGAGAGGGRRAALLAVPILAAAGAWLALRRRRTMAA